MEREIMTAIELRYLLHSKTDLYGVLGDTEYSNKQLRYELLRFQNHVEFNVLLENNCLLITLKRV